jgi:hypothetical protein
MNGCPSICIEYIKFKNGVEELFVSCGNLQPNPKKIKCDKCKCGESICTRELREQLRKIVGKRITVLTRANIPGVIFIVGRLIKVDCGTIIVESEIQQITGPILIKICDILALACGNAFDPVQTTACDFLQEKQLHDTCLHCDCKCTENECIRELRKELQSCIGKDMGITTPVTPIDGTLLDVRCGYIILRDNLIQTVYIIPLCAITSVIQFNSPNSLCGITNHTKECKLKCHCECIEDICTESLRDELRKCMGKEVTITLEGNAIEFGRIVKVNCGTIILQLASPILIPICAITSVRRGNQLPPNGLGTTITRIIRK